ncbi:competence/damage-inducible protein A [Flavobacterium agrisoli]|uniref:CinA-like protein n=1 Tax=Flavobacterium agrisoli TaxID=2793066 RepID=A0A934PMZ8_9FLAO|nr:competence/damage-inducible protein A [Flavobacterium agrisoli]MBK0369908.1 competence/damage-inducible protein A [Flavobacterium agrisoli]
MKAAIVTIGDEILIGQITDTNSAYIAQALDKIGIAVVQLLSIGDDQEQIIDTFARLQNQVDLVVVTGGLGPTKDDITKKTFCKYFDDELIVNPEVLAHVTQLLEGIFKKPITQINKDQALVPSRSKVLHNAVGTAPGMWMQKENTVFVSLPGVPYEMKHLMDEVLLPKIIKNFERPYILHKTLITYGLGESLLAERIEEWEDQLPPAIKLAYLPSPGLVRLRLSARGTDEEILRNQLDVQIAQLKPILHDIVVSYEAEEALEVTVLRILQEQNKTIATAESCTGGKIAATLASVPGCSNNFKGGIVAYATEVKIDLLGVDQNTIEKHSVVSMEVAREMALQAQKKFKTDYAIATTGNAGPSKGDSDASVGTVCIAIATPNEVLVEVFNFGQPREKVVQRTVVKSLEMLHKEILKNVP